MLHKSAQSTPLLGFHTTLLFLAVAQFSSQRPSRFITTRCHWLIEEKETLAFASPKDYPYYRCIFHRNGSSTFYSYVCPEGTCFDFENNVCSNMACLEVGENFSDLFPQGFKRTPFVNLGFHEGTFGDLDTDGTLLPKNNPRKDTPTTTTPFPAFISPMGRSLGGLEYAAAVLAKANQQNNTEDHPTKNDGNSEHILPNSTEVVAGKSSKEIPWKSTSPYYNCTSRRYNCPGPGLFADPDDQTIFYRCGFHEVKMKWYSVTVVFYRKSTCFPCNERFNKCFSIYNQACIDCSDVGTYQEYTTDVISIKTSYDCVGYKAFPCSKMGYGLHEHPGDKSIAVHCTNDTFQVGQWMGGCITCSRKNFACFIEGIEQCIEDCTGGRLHPYNCSHYKLTKENSCAAPGKFATPLDNTTYYECGTKGATPECRPCPKGLFFDTRKERCVSEEEIESRRITKLDMEPVLIGGYDCKRYKHFVFPCRHSGYFASPNDTSVYFSCLPTPKGGFTSWCYSCNELHKTCFDDLQKACVTVGATSPCGSSVQLQNTSDKGTPGSSKTYSCEGYNNHSFPCAGVNEGFYGMPGDSSVYVHCEDTNGDKIAEWVSCHTCTKETSGCFNENFKKCVHYCASGNTNHSDHVTPNPNKGYKFHLEIPVMPPMTKLTMPIQGQSWSEKESVPWVLTLPNLAYDCKQVRFKCNGTGVFVNTSDPSVWFECVKGKQANCWDMKCQACPKGFCFDVETRACTVTCRGSHDNWKFMMCRDKWTYLCELMGIG